MLSSIFTVSLAQSAIELGCIYALVALALFVSFSILNIADLSTDGCFTLGCAVCAMVTLQGHPFLGLLAAMGAGVASGFVTAFLQTRLGVESILAGIIVNTGLYTINIAVMGFSSTINLFASKTIFTMAKEAIGGNWYEIIAILIIIVIVAIVLILFLGTRLGLSIRATGDNPFMVRASSISPIFTITVGLCVANAMTGLSGGLLAQYQRSCDINIGTGQVTIALASLIIGETLIGLKIQELEEKGLSFEEVVEQTEAYILSQDTWFVLENLDTLRKNGRLGTVKALVATALKIKPVMGSTDEGTIIQLDQARGMKKALVKMVNSIEEKKSSDPQERMVGIAHCNCPQRAEMVKEEIIKRLPFKDVILVNTAGVSTMYANDGGIIVVA